MYPLFETICIRNGEIQNVAWHQRRYEKSYQLFFGKSAPNHITAEINIPDSCFAGTFKMRILYNETSKEVAFEKYTFTAIRTLKIVEDDSIDYGLKYSDRAHLSRLSLQKENCDDVLIIRNNQVTDTTICNIVFWDGTDWSTPATPLLNGTARDRLLVSGQIKAREIHKSDMDKFISFKLINAMRDFEKIEESDMKNIIF